MRMIRILVAALLAAGGGAEALAEDQPKFDLSKGGPTFQSGNNSLTIGARVQLRYTADDREEFDADLVGEGDGEEDGLSHSFDIARMRVGFKGGMWKPWLKYEFQFEFNRTSGDSSSKVKDAYLEFDRAKLATLRVGQFKTPFSLQELISSGRQQFVDRAITNLKFAPARDTGVMLTGVTDEKFFGYAAGIFNGSGESRAQDDEGLLYVGRVWFDPLGEYKLAESALDHPEEPILHFGLGLRTGEVTRGLSSVGVFEEPNDETAYNLEFAYRQKWFSATAEYFGMSDEQENPTSADDVDSNGWHAQVGFMVVPKKFELGLRYAAIEPDESVDDADVTETRLVAGYYWQGHNLKLQGDVGQVELGENFDTVSPIVGRGLPLLIGRLVTGEELTDRVVRVQVQLAF